MGKLENVSKQILRAPIAALSGTRNLTAPFGQCGGTRGALGNWSTHVSKLTP
jgi:hypothetical protein